MKRKIILKKVAVHNLKSVDVTLDPEELIVCTGVSGSGKSSFAFDTLYMEGQRRYVESLSTFARRQMGEMAKPNLESASGISPTISIEQKTAGRNPRSTVGTISEVYDYLRVLYARVATPHCPVSGEAVLPQSKERIIRTLQSKKAGSRWLVLAPFARGRKGEFKEDFAQFQKLGYMRVRIDGEIVNLAESISLDKSVDHDIDIVLDRIQVEPQNFSRIAEALTEALRIGKGLCSIQNPDTKEEELFSQFAYSPKSGLSYPALEPQNFSFNTPQGMCERCNGMGAVNEYDINLVVDFSKSIKEDCCSVGSSYSTVYFGNIYDNLARIYNFDINTPFGKLPKDAQDAFLHGIDKKYVKMRFVHKDTGKTWTDYVHWNGVLGEAMHRYNKAKSSLYRRKQEELMVMGTCSLCQGSRLKAYPSAATLGGKKIHELTQMPSLECLNFFKKLKLTKEEALIGEDLLHEITARLQFIVDVGLHYLCLDRAAPTLSGGEAQRIRLASQIGCGLVGITYVLDEPSIGLHPQDNKKLIDTLKRLRDLGNTVVVVEHDEDTIRAADRILEFGPGPGSHGGQVIVNGELSDLLSCKNSITADYLTGRRKIEIPKKRRKKGKEEIVIKGATHHNLKNVSASFPIGTFIAVTGPSGSGKSSLISETLFPALSNKLQKSKLFVGPHISLTGADAIDKVIGIDQSPIGRNPRSNPSTYCKVFDDVRDLFSALPESRAKGFEPGRFSFNVREGSCPQCVGMGMIKIDMDFMEAAWVDCPLCKGRRFDPETLSVHYREKNIYDILEMCVEEAFVFFKDIPHIKEKLQTLIDVGMHYVLLGQSSTTLSGGEAQRIKLAKELLRPSTGKTLYILDEPTTGLHFHDINNLLRVLHSLVDKGNTVIVIEHNMDVAKTADFILDLGPGGGAEGGQIAGFGRPEEIAKKKTPTGEALRTVLNPNYEILSTRSKKKEGLATQEIEVAGALQNNLKFLNASLPRNQLTICTGPSGSGKSSFAFETIYAEGQRRYIESLSPYARQFVEQMPKPKVASVSGLSPSIAIEQKAHAGNPRSTLGTMTEIYDYLRLLYARVGLPHCPDTKEIIQAISKDHVLERVLSYPEGERLQILAPIELKKSEPFETVLERLRKKGYLRIRLNGTYYSLDEVIPFDRKRKNELFLVVDRLKVDPSAASRLFESFEVAEVMGKGKIVIAREAQDVFFNLAFAVEKTGVSYPEITPHTFAFNTPEGMCPACLGLGIQYGANLEENGDIMQKTVLGLMRYLFGIMVSKEALSLLGEFFEQEGIDPKVKLKDLPPGKLQVLIEGSKEGVLYTSKKGFQFRFPGISVALAKIAKSAKGAVRDQIAPLLDEIQCPSCKGSRINPLARNVLVDGVSIDALCRWPVSQVLAFIKKVAIVQDKNKILEDVQKQMIQRLEFLCEVGLDYLSLDRRAPTLSGGEAQRTRLARQLGSGLTGVLYVLDEPSIGLHPRDTDRLCKALVKLKDLQNTLVLVEHDPATIALGDYILDFGPGAGEEGGHITARGTLKEIENNPESLTGAYLSGRKSIPLPKRRRKPTKGALHIQGANLHNLKNVKLDVPLGVLTCLTGVSGSGKSTLLQNVLLPALQKGVLSKDEVAIESAKVSGIKQIDKVLSITQDPIGLTARSDVGTYCEILTKMRTFFAALPEARMLGLQPKHFSFNHRAGMCTQCYGMGYKKIFLHFLPPVQVTCDECAGLRLNPVSLGVKYKDRNFGEYLDCTVHEIKEIFAAHPQIVRICTTLISVGLGYLKLGQEMATLSGGEAQRMKISKELSKRSTGRTIYLLDEPTTGQHPSDIEKLLQVLHTLVDKGNTVVVIEHNLDLIKNADWIIDLGPESGEKGGEILYEGPPVGLLQEKRSWTAKYLAPFLA